MTEEIKQFLKEQEEKGYFLLHVPSVADDLADMEFKEKFEYNDLYKYNDLYEEVENAFFLKEKYQEIYDKMHEMWENYLILDCSKDLEND